MKCPAGLAPVVMILVLATATPSAQGAATLPYWRDASRGWHFYEDPAPVDSPVPGAPAQRPPTKSPEAPRRQPQIPEVAALEALRAEVETLRAIAVMRPSESNVRRYMELEAQVVARASAFADVAQRVAWTTPELDPSLRGRPVNARAIEVHDARQLVERSRTTAALGRDHLLLFFFRSDCPYCKAFAPTLAAFQLRHGLRVEAVSIDGGVVPGFESARIDNGTAAALQVTQVPALYLAQPFTGRIVPIGFGVLSESQLLERITTVSTPEFEALMPGAIRQLARP